MMPAHRTAADQIIELIRHDLHKIESAMPDRADQIHLAGMLICHATALIELLSADGDKPLPADLKAGIEKLVELDAGSQSDRVLRDLREARSAREKEH